MTRSLPLCPNRCIFLVLMRHFSFSCGNPARPRPGENTAHGKIFSCWSHKEDLHTAYPNMVTKSPRYAKSRDFYKKNESKNEELLCWEYRNIFVDVLKSIQWENLFDPWNMELFSDFCHLKTFLATRLVFYLFWRWQPVAHTPFQQPGNAAVLKRSRPYYRGSFLKKIYENFVGTLETVRNI